MTPTSGDREHLWHFPAPFKAKRYGLESRASVKKVLAALYDGCEEIETVSATDPATAALGAVLLLETMHDLLLRCGWPGEDIDTRFAAASRELSREYIAEAELDDRTRDQLLDRLLDLLTSSFDWIALPLAEKWGPMCAAVPRASEWADRFLEHFDTGPWPPVGQHSAECRARIACMSSMLSAGRHEQLLGALESSPADDWAYRRWGMQALVAQGRYADASEYALSVIGKVQRDSDSRNPTDARIAAACERILLDAGEFEAAYAGFAVLARLYSPPRMAFDTIRKTYPDIGPARVFDDLVRRRGEWVEECFNVGMDAGLFDQAIEFGVESHAPPPALIAAAQMLRDRDARLAAFAAVAALEDMADFGVGYSSDADITLAFEIAIEYGRALGLEDEIRQFVADKLAYEASAGRDDLARALGDRAPKAAP